MKLRQKFACTALVGVALSIPLVTPIHAANAGGKCSKASELAGTRLNPLICKRIGKKLVWRKIQTTTVTVAPTTTVTVVPTTTVTVAPTTTVTVVPTTTVTVAPTTTVTVAPTTTVAKSSCPTGQVRIVPDELRDGFLFFFNVYNETSASVSIDYVRVKFFGSSYGTSINSSYWQQTISTEIRPGWTDYRQAQSSVISPNGFLYDAAYRWYRTQYDVYQGNRLCSPPMVVLDQSVLVRS